MMPRCVPQHKFTAPSKSDEADVEIIQIRPAGDKADNVAVG
jgi:hypothetical protein